MIEIEILSEEKLRGQTYLSKVEGIIAFKNSRKSPLRFTIKGLGVNYYTLSVGQGRRTFIVYQFREAKFTQTDYKNRRMIQWIYDNLDLVESCYK